MAITGIILVIIIAVALPVIFFALLVIFNAALFTAPYATP